jgi:hypothetical protein
MTISENIQHSIDTGLRKCARGKDHWHFGGKSTWATGPKMKWLYIIPGEGVFNYKELKKRFPDSYPTLSSRCKRGIKGHYKEKGVVV